MPESLKMREWRFLLHQKEAALWSKAFPCAYFYGLVHDKLSNTKQKCDILQVRKCASALSMRPLWDEANGEFTVTGKRHVLIDVQAFCDHIESLVGTSVTEVIIDNHESRLGREDAERIRKERVEASEREVIDLLVEADRLSGTGLASVILPDNLTRPILLQILNPCVKGSRGAGKSFLLSYWAGALSYLLGQNFAVRNVVHDEAGNLLKCEIVRRPV